MTKPVGVGLGIREAEKFWDKIVSSPHFEAGRPTCALRRDATPGSYTVRATTQAAGARWADFL